MMVMVLAAVWLSLALAGVDAGVPFVASASSPTTMRTQQFTSVGVFGLPRGGASVVDEEDEYDEYDEEEEDDDEEEEEDSAMAKATIKAAQKKSKKEIASKRSTSKPIKTASITKKKKSFSLKKLIPYIVRATLNPVTCIQMIKGYWSSLFNFNYLSEVRFLGVKTGNCRSFGAPCLHV